MVYKGAKLLQISMPMGGIGAGCVCLNGYGGLQDFSIYNKPATSAQADGHGFRDAAFAMLHVKGSESVTRLIEGPIPPEKLYNQGLQGQGYRGGGHEGIPRFESCEFENHYPFGIVRLADPKIPVKVEIRGWSPFVPNDEKVSGIPAAILTYTFENTSKSAVELEFSYHLAHPAQGSKGEEGTRNRLLSNHQGVEFFNTEEPNNETFGSAAVAVSAHDVRLKGMWFRGGWFDSISALHREVSSGDFRENNGSASDKGQGGRNGGSLLVPVSLKPGEKQTFSVVLTWYFPNVPYSVGIANNVKMTWHPWYATQWKDAADVSIYVLDHLESLRIRTEAFADAIHGSTLPKIVTDAIASNLAIVKSPTVLRQSSGNMWAWEGCFVNSGCCHGSCTHVWNYAQAFPHLFPALERTLREQEYIRSMDPKGHINFRSALPDNPTSHDFHAASDGQLGGILKLYRDWHISGDTEWMKKLYPLAKRSLDYCIETWDPDHQGALFEPHHNTYDIEFWGPDGMCSSIYIGALCAMAEMGEAAGDGSSSEYHAIAEKGAKYLDSNLFNGDYYEHHVQWENLRDSSFSELLAKIPNDTDDDVDRLLKKEGPKYQYGTGCLSDGVIGAWMARLYGVETPLSQKNVRHHLSSIFRFNFKKDLFEHACLQRPGYALGHESGLLLCTWPRGGKPTLPFVYSDEVWTGIEYQVASHCLCEGLIDEGMHIVEAARGRYDGHVRNPFNEYECGSYYARAMASYALLQAVTGFWYSAVTGELRIDASKPMRTFFSAASGFGTISVKGGKVTVSMIEGSLDVKSAVVTAKDSRSKKSVNAVASVGSPISISV
ncbi:MAG: hypothetical protein JST12_10355 [Armatimonadetes bacterium]|nr:hypothetical protein [Armatimonadota bacterium]